MIEKVVIDTSVIILLNKKKEVLLQKKDQGYPWFPGKWCLFGGGIEPGEEPSQTLIREISEEIGSIPSNLKLFKKTSYFENYIPDKIREGELQVYVGEFTGKISDISLGEGGGFGFFAENELDTIPIVDYNLKILKEFYSSLRQ